MPEVLTAEPVLIPPLYADPTGGMELSTADTIALEATRYIFTAFDFIDPSRKDELDYLQRGGEETGNVCLRRTPNQFLPRCSVTPLELWGQELPLTLFPSDGMDTRSPLRLKQRTDTQLEPGEVLGKQRLSAPLFFYPFYPGEMVLDATGLTTSERKGIVELTPLRGVDWETGEAQAVQSVLFPADWPVPMELRLIEERIRAIRAANLDPDLRTICDEMLTGCEQSRRWATRKIDLCNAQLDKRTSHEWTYSYSSPIRNYMAQLEVKPRYTGAEQINDQVLKALSTSGLSPELLSQMQERDANLVTELGKVMATALANAVKSLNPPATVQPEAAKE